MKTEIKNTIVQQVLCLLTDPNRVVYFKNGKVLMPKIILNHLIRWYPQVSIDGTDLYGKGIKNDLINLNITQRAMHEISSHCKNVNLTLPELKTKIDNATHYEHNVPVKIITQKLIALATNDINFKNIKTILESKYEVILISQEENHALNAKLDSPIYKNKKIILDGKETRGKGLSTSGTYHGRLDSIKACLINDEEKITLIKNLENRLKPDLIKKGI